jgi:hypothetical protein
MDPRNCQTATASPAKPGELPFWFRNGVIPFFEQHEHFFKDALNKPSPAGRGLGEGLLDQSVAQIAFPTGDFIRASLMVGRDKVKPFPARGIGMNAGPIGRTADWHAPRPKGTAHGRAV